MSERNRNIVVGLFVLAGALGITTCAVILGGSGAFERRIRIESYFDEPVTGLSVGSPLRYRGVTIGEVVSIGFVQDYYDLSEEDRLEYGQRVSVLFERRFREDESEEIKTDSYEEQDRRLQELIDRGLRLRLTASAITGTAFVQADIVDPEAFPPMTITWEPQFIYIPSAPSRITSFTQSAERIVSRLDQMDLPQLADSAIALLDSLDQASEGLELGALQDEASALIKDLELAVGEMRGAVKDAELGNISDKAQQTLDQARSTLLRLERTIDSGRYDFEVSLENLRVATENLRDLTDLLKRQPSLLIRSEPGEAEEPGGDGE